MGFFNTVRGFFSGESAPNQDEQEPKITPQQERSAMTSALLEQLRSNGQNMTPKDKLATITQYSDAAFAGEKDALQQDMQLLEKDLARKGLPKNIKEQLLEIYRGLVGKKAELLQTQTKFEIQAADAALKPNNNADDGFIRAAGSNNSEFITAKSSSGNVIGIRPPYTESSTISGRSAVTSRESLENLANAA